MQVEEKYNAAVKAGQDAANAAESNATKAGQTAANNAEKNAKADTAEKLKSYSTTEQMTAAIKMATDNITLEVTTVRQAVSEKNGNFYGSKIPTTSNEPASSWTSDDLKSLHIGDIYYDITTGYAYRYTYKVPGLKITFSSDSRTESVKYDYVKIYYNDNGTMKLAAKLGGTDIAGASVFVPSSEFYVYWRTDTSSDSFYGFKIASVTGTTGEATGTVENLPNYTATELAKGTYPESPNHGSYGNNINLLWKCSGTTSGSKTGAWERIQDQDISVAKAQADAAQSTANTAKSTADTAKSTAETAKSTAETAISRITVAEGSITSEVTRAKNAESSLSSRVTQTETKIESKVSAGNIASSINQTAQSVKINASKINFNGAVTANNYFKINTDGSFSCVRGKIGNFEIKSNYIYAGSAYMSVQSHAFRINGGLQLYAGTSTFSDGSDRIQIFNLTHVTSGGYVAFASDGSTIAYRASSSRRYKDHVSNMSLEEAEKILNIPVVWFKYKDGYLDENDQMNNKSVPGMYAEDVFESFPEATYNNAEGQIENWNERMILPAMLKLLQELYRERNTK